MPKIFAYTGQAVAYLAIMAVVGYFSNQPTYQYRPPDKAVIKMAFSHGGKAKGGCRKRSEEELKKLAPSRRVKYICSRERLPVTVALAIDGKEVFHKTLKPKGIRKDGPSIVYESFLVDAGEHEILARLRDSDRKTGWDYESRKRVTLKPQQNFVIQFRPETGGFTFK